ncbi:hypothetical protein pb186bvf_018315 [Paramecium bursaria]
MQRTYAKYKCAICDKPTKTCCSLCRDPFYCNQQHQRQHWNMGHNLECQEQLLNVRSDILKKFSIKESIPDKSIQKLNYVNESILASSKNESQLWDIYANQLLETKVVLKQGQIQKAREFLLCLRTKICEVQQNNKKNELLVSIAHLFYDCGDFNNSEQTYMIYIRLLEEQQQQIAKGYYDLAIFYLRSQYIKKANLALRKAEQSTQDQELLSNIKYHLGLICQIQSEYHNAWTYYNQSLKLRISEGQSLSVSSCLEQLAKIEIIEGCHRMLIISEEDFMTMIIHRQLGYRTQIIQLINDQQKRKGNHEITPYEIIENLNIVRQNKQTANVLQQNQNLLDDLTYQSSEIFTIDDDLVNSLTGDQLMSLRRLKVLLKQEQENALQKIHESDFLQSLDNTQLKLFKEKNEIIFDKEYH